MISKATPIACVHAERVTIWAGTSLSEQLFIAQIVQVADSAGVDPARLHLVQYEKNPSFDAPVVTIGRTE